MSTIPAVKAALVSLFTTSLSGSDVQVLYGPRGNVTVTEASVVEVGGAAGENQSTSLSLNESEDYVITITVSVTIPSGTQRAATEAVIALWVEAKALVRNLSGGPLGVPGVTSVRPSGAFELIETPNPDGPNAAIQFGVHVLAR